MHPYHIDVESLEVLHHFLLDLVEGRLRLEIELLFLLVLRDLVEIEGSHLVLVGLVLLEGSEEGFHFDLESFLH
jgi:hypothetical protein